MLKKSCSPIPENKISKLYAVLFTAGVLLSRYRYVKCLTRDENTVDCCYTIIKDAYPAVSHVPFGLSDQRMVHLLPTYGQKFKTARPVVQAVLK